MSGSREEYAHDRQLPLGTRIRLGRLKRYYLVKETTSERNLRLALIELEILTDKLHLPKGVRENAATIYRTAVRKDLLIGRTISEFVAASVYAACRQFRVPRTLDEISSASGMDKKEIAKAYRLLIRELSLRMPIDDPVKFVTKMASELNVRRETELLTEEIIREARKRGIIVGKDPLGIAAAALYLACKAKNEKCTQKNIAASAGITDLTIRNRLRDLKPIIEQMDRRGS